MKFFIKRAGHTALHLLPLALFGIALYFVHHEIRTHNLREIAHTIRDMPWQTVAIAIGLTALNYLVLAGYDILALRYTGHKEIPLHKITLVSLIGYAISNNTGHAWASGGSVRYRFYSQWGVPGWDVIRISLFLGITYLLGVITMGLAGTLLMPADLQGNINQPALIPWIMGVSAACLLVYWGAVFLWRKPVVIKGITMKMPGPFLTLGQTIISSADVFLSALVLWVFLSGHVSFEFQTFIIIFVIAQVAGLFSQVPGGIGVFEGMFLSLLGTAIAPGEHLEIIGSLILYRVVYFFLPLAVAGFSLLGYEINARRKALSEGGKVASRILSNIMPQLFAILLLITGAILLVSGATPAVPEHMKWLRSFMPLPIVEISHLLGSLTGLLLLFLARGIYLRLDAAWYGSIILLIIGIVVSFLKGFDWREANALIAMLVLLLPARGFFRRKSSLFNMSMSWEWIGMVAAMLAGSIWLGLFSFHHVAYRDQLWWKFSYEADAPRFLRASLLMFVVATAYLLTRLLAVARPKKLSLPSAQDINDAAAIARAGDETQSFLALLGDKKMFWSEDRSAFIMFGDTPKYWIAMGNPVGNTAAFEALLWRFREQADLQDVKIVFYEAGDKHLPLYLDHGLTLLKTGEEAKVRLADFNLDGGRRETLRKTRNKFAKQNFTFEILDFENVTAVVPQLRIISDQWLAKKNTREKGFSLGFFTEDYIVHTRVAVIRNPEGQILAFANLWQTDNKNEICIDMMRYNPDSPTGIMDYLFAELMMWAKEKNYIWFSLGMAPLAGLERHALAPLWHKIGAVIYDLSEGLYNFEGVHDYKAKYDPEWFPRYLAAPAGLSAPIILMTVAKLVAGGWKGIFIK